MFFPMTDRHYDLDYCDESGSMLPVVTDSGADIVSKSVVPVIGFTRRRAYVKGRFGTVLGEDGRKTATGRGLCVG